MNDVKNKLENQYTDILTIDGIKVTLDSTKWVLIRSSNTEPKIRITVEADSMKNATQILDEFTKKVQSS